MTGPTGRTQGRTTQGRGSQGRGTHIVVLGAGYAGVMAANRVRASLTPAESGRVRVTVVNPVERFVERIRLHQLVAGSVDDATVPLADVLHDDVAVLVGTASRVEPRARRVVVATPAGEQVVAYDQLVYAVGSAGGATWRTEPGAAERRDPAHPEVLAVADHGSASRARAVIAAAGHEGPVRPAGVRVAVVGGGLTGIETAAEMAEQGASVTLVTSGVVGAGMRPAARRRIVRRLERLGVTVREGATFRGTAPGVVVLDAGAARDGRLLPTDLCLWAGPFAVPSLARDSGLPTAADGRLVVGPDLRCADHPEIVGAGDAVVLPPDVGGHLRMSCAAAMPLGAAAAATVLATLREEAAPHASVGHLLQCVSLGRRDGYVQLVHVDDTPRRLALSGIAGARLKEAVCAMTLRALRTERARPGSYRSPRGPRAASVQ